MINVKWSLISAGAAFALALIISLLLGQVAFSVAIIRALLFAAVFFGLGAGISALVKTFIPELLASVAPNDAVSNVFSSGAAGSRVNISVGDTSNIAVPDAYASSTDEVGTFNELLARSISSREKEDVDQSAETGYSEHEESEEVSPSFDNVKTNDDLGDFSMDFGVFFSNDGSSDSDSVEDAFSLFPGSGSGGSSARGVEDDAPQERKVAGNKPMELKGDFDPREIAAGLRTVLQKDKG